jgi:hypothetical protein
MVFIFSHVGCFSGLEELAAHSAREPNLSSPPTFCHICNHTIGPQFAFSYFDRDEFRLSTKRHVI